MVGTLLYLLLDNRISLISLLYDGASDSAHIKRGIHNVSNTRDCSFCTLDRRIFSL